MILSASFILRWYSSSTFRLYNPVGRTSLVLITDTTRKDDNNKKENERIYEISQSQSQLDCSGMLCLQQKRNGVRTNKFSSDGDEDIKTCPTMAIGRNSACPFLLDSLHFFFFFFFFFLIIIKIIILNILFIVYIV